MHKSISFCFLICWLLFLRILYYFLQVLEIFFVNNVYINVNLHEFSWERYYLISSHNQLTRLSCLEMATILEEGKDSIQKTARRGMSSVRLSCPRHTPNALAAAHVVPWWLQWFTGLVTWHDVNTDVKSTLYIIYTLFRTKPK